VISSITTGQEAYQGDFQKREYSVRVGRLR
jgi:hypothetical protein